MPSLQGVTPSTIVAFRYSGGWQQIPVQVDQRFTQTLQNVYNNIAGLPSNTNIPVLVYADPNTFTGADPNPNVDADDEIALMAKDAGDASPTSIAAASRRLGSGVELTVTDPLQPGAAGYVYLFKQDGTLDPAVGQSYVSYNFNLLSGDYKTTYNLHGTMGTTGNPENSTVTTAYYARHFLDRWADDELHFTSGGSTWSRHPRPPQGALRSRRLRAERGHIRPRHTDVPGRGCVRHEQGRPDPRHPLVHRRQQRPEHAARAHLLRAARGHPHVPARARDPVRSMDFFDYSPAASGMTYYNNLNTGGVTIDGVPETPAPDRSPGRWSTGAQGSLVLSGSTSTNVPGFSYTSYYLDDTTPPVTQCTGDAFAYGSSGVYVNMSIPNTDPGIRLARTTSTPSARSTTRPPTSR